MKVPGYIQQRESDSTPIVPKRLSMRRLRTSSVMSVWLTLFILFMTLVGGAEPGCPKGSFSKHVELQKAISSGKEVILLCSLVTLGEQDTLRITRNMKMECVGTYPCTIQGGREQIILDGENITFVEFSGIVFAKSSQTSISIYTGTPNGSTAITFKGCVWNGITGTSAISIDPVVYDAPSMGAGNISTTHDFLGNRMVQVRRKKESNLKVDIHGCSFQGNTVDRSIIIQSSGVLTVTETIFSGNEVNDDLVGSLGGTLLVTNSELRNNVVLTGRAPLVLGLDAELAINKGNCGDDSDTCNGIVARLGNCTEPKCDLFCYSLDVCPRAPTKASSTAPTSSTMVPSSLPTVMYLHTSIAPEMSPGSRMPSRQGLTLKPGVTSDQSGSDDPTSEITNDDHASLAPLQSPVALMIPTRTGTPSLTLGPSKYSYQVPSLESDDTSNNNEGSESPTKTGQPSGDNIPSNPPSVLPVPTRITLANPCPSNKSILGYVDSQSLLSDLAAGMTSEFVLCPNTNFSGQLEFHSNITGTTFITCGDRNCDWEGGESHIIVLSNINLVVEGVTFRRSSRASVIMQCNSSDQTKIIFRNCTWDANTGEAAILLSGIESVSHNTSKTSNNYTASNQGRRSVQESASVTFEQCSFILNNVKNVVLVQRGASLNISNCLFLQNIAHTTLVTSTDGKAYISMSRFENNVFNASLGLATLSAESKINKNGSCVFESKTRKSTKPTGQICDGVLFKIADANCSVPNQHACTGYCEELDKCNMDNCINSWNLLQSEISQVFPEGAVFIICPGTIFDLDSAVVDNHAPLNVSESRTVLKCGDSGDRDNNCVISGGDEQIRITGSSIGVEFKGITFVGSRRTAISAEGNPAAQVFFRYCSFLEHQGLAVIVNARISFSVSEFTSVIELKAPTNQGIELDVDSCLFQDNNVTLATILGIGGSLSVNDTIFMGNSGQVGVVAALFKGKLNLLSSCFLGNTGEIATLYVDASSFLRQNTENYAFGNTVDPGSCVDLSLDSKKCIVFNSRFCNSSVDIAPRTAENHTTCFFNYSDFATAVSSNYQGGVFEICPGSVFDLGNRSTVLPVLQIKSNNVTILCGRDGSRLNGCSFIGGENQIIISGKLTNVQLRGLTFVGASGQAVLVQGSAPFSVLFSDCDFRDAVGSDVIVIESIESHVRPTQPSTSIDNSTKNSSISEMGSNKVTNGGRMIEETKVGVFVAFVSCSFHNNTVEDSVVTVKGAMVNITIAAFESNHVGGSLVYIKERGQLLLRATCFTNNTFSGPRGLVSIDAESTVDMLQNFGSENLGSSGKGKDICKAVVKGATGECIGFDLHECQGESRLGCIADWEILAETVVIMRRMQRGSILTLCEDTTVFPGEFNAIEIDISDIVIRCGSSGNRLNRCSISGGSTQFKISGSPIGVVFQGITFLSSSIAAIDASGDRNAILSIIDCAFAYNSGFAAISVYGGDIRSLKSPGTRRRLAVDNSISPTGSMTINVQQCYFEKNRVIFAPLAVLGGVANVGETGFFGNTGNASGVGVWFEGSINISLSCFTGNHTPILVTEGSNIDSAGSFYGIVDSDAGCGGALVGDKCNEFSAASCPIKGKLVLPPVKGCYDDWVDLDEAIQQATSNRRKTVNLVVCENTLFDLDSYDDSVSPIVVSEQIADGNLSISCGKGSSENGNCSVSGGRGHFKINSTRGHVVFDGFTFFNASVASIQAAGKQAALVTFQSCRWIENRGSTVIIVYNEVIAGSVYTEKDFTNLAPPKDLSMHVRLDNCNISSNNASFSIVLNLGGTLDISETVISKNHMTRVGAIGIFYSASFGISDSCLSGNAAIYPGIIFVDRTSNVTFFRKTFGNQNTVSIGNCDSIFLERPCIDGGDCAGGCLEFDARTCESDNDLGTLAPKSAPNQFPSSTPSMEVVAEPNQPNTNGSAVETQDEKSLNTQLVVGISISIVLCIGAMAAFMVLRAKKNSACGDAGTHDRLKLGYLSNIDETRPLEFGQFEEKFFDEHDEEHEVKGGFFPLFGFDQQQHVRSGDEGRYKSFIAEQEMTTDTRLGDYTDQMEMGKTHYHQVGKQSRRPFAPQKEMATNSVFSNENAVFEVEREADSKKFNDALDTKRRSSIAGLSWDQKEYGNSIPSLNESRIETSIEQKAEAHSSIDLASEVDFRSELAILPPKFTIQPDNDVLKMEDPLVVPSGGYVEGSTQSRGDDSPSPEIAKVGQNAPVGTYG